MDRKTAPAPSIEKESSAASWNPALRSEKADATPVVAKPPAAAAPEPSSEEESDEEEEDEESEEEEEEEEEESDEEEAAVPVKSAIPAAPASASTTKLQSAPPAPNGISNTQKAANQAQAESSKPKPSSEVDALAAATQNLNINAQAPAPKNATSSDEEESDEEEDEESSDEEAVPSKRPAAHYEHQGDVSALEQAVGESEEAPLVADAAPVTDDWGNSDDTFDLGGQPQEAPLETPQAEAVGTTVGDAVIGNTTVGGNTGDDMDWGNAGGEEDFFGGGASQIIENAPAAEQTPGAHVVESSDTKPAKNEWDLDLDLDLDDDFLEEQDAPAIELSDDEGFLEDEPAPPAQPTTASTSTSRYAPQSSNHAPTTSTSPYAPQSQFANVPQTSQQKAVSPIAAYGGFGQNIAYQQQQQARPTSSSSAQSFADKSKGGYASPYDMPDDIVTTRKRPAPRTSLPAAQPTPPPPRTSSMSSASAPPRPLLPSNMSAASLSPPSSAQSMQGMTGAPPSGPAKTAPPAKPASSDFFAELPVASKPRPSGRYTPSQNTPAHSPSFPPPHALPPKERTASWSSLRNEVLPDSIGAPSQFRQPDQLPMFPSQPSVPARQNSLPPPSQPPPSSRYSPAPPAAGPAATSRYSPAPPSTTGAANARYSPAPGAQGPSHARYVSEPPTGPPRPPSQTYAPRTSSPLAYHTTPHQQESPVPDSAAQQYPGHHVSQSADALPRAPFRSPLEGVSETDEQGVAPYPQAPPTARSETPPMRSSPSSVVGSPRKKGNYTPQYQPTQGVPSRSLSQSPATSMRQSTQSYSALPTATPYSMYSADSASTSVNVIPHRRQASVDYECIVPDDERAADPLQRWKGYPIFTWGLGGTIVTSIPKQIPRYGGGMTAPMVKCSPGEIKIQSIKDVLPLPEDVSKFPGPLKGKNKKKDVLSWLSKKVEVLEARLKEPSLEHSMALEDSARSEDKLLLLKLLHLLVEHDGRLEGDVAVTVVKKLFSPPGEDGDGEGGSFSTGADIVGRSRSNTSNIQAEPVDSRAVEDLQTMLSKGEREKAVWHAVDQRLWGHAMLLSSTLSKDIWKQVVQEFVRKEVKKVGRNNQPLAVLYEVFAGNHEDCIDELVPASARAGFQMMSTDGAGAIQDAKQGLDKWRETIALILNNRSEGDASALLSLGRLLAQYGRTEAAHTCFIFARAVARLGGIDDAQADLVLIGVDHKQHSLELGQDLEPILLTEVYEFALSLSAQAGPYTMPHLQTYKLMHAYQLAENGYRTDAQAYCDAIVATTALVTKKSPYYSAAFMISLEDLSKRLSQSPKDSSSSWISKPSMDRVSTSLLSKFNNFIAGDDDTDLGKAGGAEIGPFAKIAGDSPSITPSQSSADLYGAYGGYNVPSPPVTANSRYAPSNTYAPRTSSEQQRSRYEPQGRPSMESLDGQRSISDAYMPMTPAMGSLSPQSQLSPPRQNKTQSYSPLRSEHSMSQPALGSPYLPTPPTEESNSENAFGGYQPQQSSFDGPSAPSAPEESFNNYAPIASTFDTPSYQPYNPDEGDDEKADDEPKPKKKSFMDDDDDDIVARASALKSGSSKSKSEADRKADEAFRKAAEEDAKRDKEAAAKKSGGGWFGGWFKKDPNAAPGPIKAKLGEESSFYYDPDLGKWVNKKAGANDDNARPSATPPPPKGPPMAGRSASGGAMPPPSSASNLMKPPTSAPMRSTSMPPPMAAPGSRASTPGLPSDSEGPKPPTLARPSFGAASGPPSRPGTSMSNASSIDDLLGAPQARKGAAGKKKKGGRYVDVFPQGQAPS